MTNRGMGIYCTLICISRTRRKKPGAWCVESGRISLHPWNVLRRALAHSLLFSTAISYEGDLWLTLQPSFARASSVLRECRANRRSTTPLQDAEGEFTGGTDFVFAIQPFVGGYYV